jgi:rare lipoprotein A
MKAAATLALVCGALASCAPHTRPSASPSVHYVVGRPYQAGGVWRYPREQFEYDATGLATVTTRRGGLTADGEPADPDAMAGAHPTLQLPAIARVTALDTGRQILVRLNDRGPSDPGRLIALTPRALALLGSNGATPLRVRVQVEEGMSRRVAADLEGDQAPQPKVTAAPVGEVRQEALAAPGATLAPPRTAAAPIAKPTAEPAAMPVPLRLPETVTRVPPRPGALAIEVASFGALRYASLLQDRLRALGARVETDETAPSESAYRVRIGPLSSVAQADAMLRRVIAAGYPDARIIAE